MNQYAEYTELITAQNFQPRSDRLKEGEAINQILRGEISGVEAYQDAIKKFDAPDTIAQLQTIANFHQEMVDHWTQEASRDQVEPSEGSGAWGFIVETFVKTAKLFGDGATLKILKQGEEHGINEYESLLKNENVSEEIKDYVKRIVLPKMRGHLVTLDSAASLH